MSLFSIAQIRNFGRMFLLDLTIPFFSPKSEIKFERGARARVHGNVQARIISHGHGPVPSRPSLALRRGRVRPASGLDLAVQRRGLDQRGRGAKPRPASGVACSRRSPQPVLYRLILKVDEVLCKYFIFSNEHNSIRTYTIHAERERERKLGERLRERKGGLEERRKIEKAVRVIETMGRGEVECG